MLFINFLCLLYLMVLIDSHTISKSIDNDEKVDDIFDSITDLDHTRNPKLRRDRFLHKYRLDEKDEYVKPIESVSDGKPFIDDKTTEKTTSIRPTTDHPKHHKSPKRRVGSFWRRFRGKDKKKHNETKQRRRRIPKRREYAWRRPATKAIRKSAPRNKGRRKNRHQFIFRKKNNSLMKREAGQILFKCKEVKKHPNKYPNKVQIGIAPHIDTQKSFKVKTVDDKPTTESLTRLLATMTTQITHLKELYGLDKYNHPTSSFSTPILDKVYESTKQTTTPPIKFEYDFPGTAQIEELLNDIKVKAIQMVAEQIPSVTDIITNTVTEATFEADPILTHLDIATPGYYLSTFVSINDIENVVDKRTVLPTIESEFINNDSDHVSNTEPHYLMARSIKEQTMTMAHNVEDMLQKEIKSIYHKVKNKVSSDFCKEVHKVKSTLKESINKLSSRVTGKCNTTTEKTTTKSTPPTTSTCPRHTRGQRKTNTPEQSRPTPTYDDYMMLTLYEQMLAKTHENNVMKMLTTVDAPFKKRREHYRLSKRNPETLTDVKLREDVQKIYEDGISMPGYDYVEPSSTTTTKPDSPENEDKNDATSSSEGSNRSSESTPTPPKDSSQVTGVTQSSLDDTSYEGLSNKISYNDFVNGYRHYLKFQKDQRHQNFSNLVRYQAHRHHKVDDIGKFILNKIPTVPSRRKRFFDDNDIEYQEISTKSDDNWFKKHFYLFIDNGPPKKFHTSQTVSLKSAITEPELRLFVSTEEPMPKPGSRDQVFIKIGSDDVDTTLRTKDTHEMNLDDLSRILESIRDKTPSGSLKNRGMTKPQKDASTVVSNNTNTVLKVIPHSFIGKLFAGKRRRTPKRLPIGATDFYPGFDMRSNYITKRLKRGVGDVISDAEYTAMDDELDSELEYKPTTAGKDFFADLGVRSNTKETNKYGYVDIDLVPRQTAVVKLRETGSKKSRFKDFFKKFNFKRPKHKKQGKRQCVYTNRRLRFDPLKKLKNIFKVKADDKQNALPGFQVAPNVPDYDMMTSHIDTFKPIKYDRPMSIDEMKKQIPNISDIVNFEPDTTRETSKHTSYVFKLDDNDRNLLYHYHITPASAKQVTAEIIGKQIGSSTSLSSTPSPSHQKSVSPKQSTVNNIPNSNVMTVNVKTMRPPLTTIAAKLKLPPTPLMTLDDMNLVLNKLQQKLAKSSRNFPRHSTPYQNLKRRTLVFATHHRQQLIPHMRPLEELTIKSKLTRIAKFPISKRHFMSTNDEFQPIHRGDDYLNFEDSPGLKEYIHDITNRNVKPDKQKLAKLASLKKLSNIAKDLDSDKCRYTDYFNDLLMWHSDILNLDKVPNPIWKTILKNIQIEGDSYTTPNMNNLIKQVDEITDFLDYDNGDAVSRLVMASNSTLNDSISRTDSGFDDRALTTKSLPGLIQSIIMDDKAIAKGKNVVIKGETKYIRYNHPPLKNQHQQSSRFISKLNSLKAHKRNQTRFITRSDKANRDDVRNEPAILIDTTLFSYDDDVESITRGLEFKKLSRNSQTSTKVKASRKSSEHSPFMKTNKAPLQYYTTPLPMKSYEFNKFLKDHKMDVETVTSPIIELPTFMDSWGGKTTKSTIKEVVKPSTETTSTKKVVPGSIKTIKTLDRKRGTTARNRVMKLSSKFSQNRPLQLKSIERRDRFGEDVDRYKRFSELNKNQHSYIAPKPTQEYNYYNMLKKKIKLFDKKSPGTLGKPSTETYTLDPHNKEVEITIINFDDIDKMTTNSYKAYDSYSLSSYKKDDSTPVYNDLTYRSDISADLLPKSVEVPPKEITDVMHNELLYKDIFKDSTIATTEFTAADFMKSTDRGFMVPPSQQDPGVTIPNKMRYPFEFLNKLPHGRSMDLPKRVHISSHHYKYDIFYTDEKKAKTGADGLRTKLSPNSSPSLDMVKPQIKITPKRHTTTTKEGSTESPPGSLVFDLKHLRRSTHVTKRARHRRLFKISSLIQDKFKMLVKNCSNKEDNDAEEKCIECKCKKEECECKKKEECDDCKCKKDGFDDYKCKKLYNHCCNCTCRPPPPPEILESNSSVVTSSDKETEAVTFKEENLRDGFKVAVHPSPTEKTTCPPKQTTTTTALTTSRTTRATTTRTTTTRTTTTRTTTTTRPTTTTTRCRTTTTKTTCAPCEKTKAKTNIFKDIPDDTLYIEPDTYGEQMYYESGPILPAPSTKKCPSESPEPGEHNDKKRDIQTQNTFTAKDVAALEVIVDLMKNTLSYEEKDVASVFNNNFIQAHATKSVPPSNDTTNSIQVHIAIPFDFQTGKKRSPLDPVRVRKVFSAKMSTPVDLEYQVHSFEGTVEPTVSTLHSTSAYNSSSVSTSSSNSSSSSPETYGLSPGMYLLVDKPKSGYALKPVKAKIDLSALKTRQAIDVTTAITEAKIETTSLKNLAKVTLTKDFIAAVSKQLIELYENLTRVNKDVDKKPRKSRSIWNARKRVGRRRKETSEKYYRKRRIDWDAVKNYFGHDRVCSCKCTANKAMCRACAASDAVIDELTFEFDNLGNYMKDHCTEIQTFFWMNPSGGQKLRDSVNRIDKSLGDYYKRVKGKCQGRPCKTFASYVDKRHIAKTNIIPKDNAVNHLAEDLAGIAEDLNKTISLKACFNRKLKKEGEKFLHAINSCLFRKTFNKRSSLNSTKKKLFKNVYSLDNINVNIICNPEISTTTETFDATTVPVTHVDSTPKVNEHLFDFDIDESKHKKRKGFKKLFPRKNKKDKLFTYFVAESTKKSKFHFKRQVNEMLTPLISDSGGAFWYDYLKGITNEPRVVRESSKDSPKFRTVLVPPNTGENEAGKESSGKKNTPVNTIYMTVKSNPKRIVQRDTDPVMYDTTTDYLTHNINQLLQLFGSLQDIEAMNMNSNRSTMFLSHATKKNKKSKAKKTTKIVKKSKSRTHYKSTKGPIATKSSHSNATSSKPHPSSKKDSTTTRSTKRTTISTAPITTTEPIETKSISDTTMSPDTTLSDPDSDNPMSAATTKETLGKLEAKLKSSTKAFKAALNHTESLDTTSADISKSSILPTDIKTVIKSQTSTTPVTTAEPDDESQFPEDRVIETTAPTTTTKPTSKHTSTSTTTASFIGKLKTATFKFFENVGKGYAVDDEQSSTTTPVDKSDSSNIVDKISETEMSLVDLDESSQITTHMSPTIVIINEYDNQNNDLTNDSSKISDGYKNLLLSIIQFETNRLNDEWHRIAYGNDRDEGVKRSIIDLKRGCPKIRSSSHESSTLVTDIIKYFKPKPSKNKGKDVEEYDMLSGIKSQAKDLELPEPPKSKKPPGLLDKIAAKLGMRVIIGGKKKVVDISPKPRTYNTVKVVQKLNRQVNKNVKKKQKRKKKWKDKTMAPSVGVEEACDTRRTSKTSQICDIQATYEHILDQQKTLPSNHFEDMVRNITCFKYKRIERSFFIPYKSVGRRWNWIRNRRSLKLHFSRARSENGLAEDFDYGNLENDSDLFEKYVKGDDGIYTIVKVKRPKRTISWKALDLGLRNIPPLTPGQNELFVMEGDSITLDCLPHPNQQSLERPFSWRTDRSNMLHHDNVEVNGIKLVIKNVEPRNYGSYTCSQDNTVQRNVRLSVVATPAFDVVFLPVYKTSRGCTYDELKSIQHLSDSMAKEIDCGDVCTIRIDEPVCQRDRGTNSSLLRSTAVISLNPRHINCSVQCRRDLFSSLVMLCAANTPALTSAGVIISKDGVNETLKPCDKLVRPVVTHSLRKKDSNGHREYHKLVSSLAPGKVDVVLICPAGYYLMQENKICASCPPNTSSSLGDNTCTSCPRGTRSEPGAAKCKSPSHQPRRYDWWWYPSCGYMVACGSLLFGCGVCVALAMLVHVATRDSGEGEECYSQRGKLVVQAAGTTAAYAHISRQRPLSPSRVILARFFKPSLTSSRATDSQETKFELWKERNMPPPLPPIDFDI